MIITTRHRSTRWQVWIVALAMILLSGVLYRLFAGKFGTGRPAEVALQVDLAAFPEQVGQWRLLDTDSGDNQVSQNAVTGVYRHESSGASAKVFLVCTARPRDIVSYRPQVCYAGDGWVHEQTDEYEVASELGREIPCNIHQFYKSVGDYQRLVVLVFYIVNGQVMSDEDTFSGLAWRRTSPSAKLRAGVSGEPGWYVAQVQISSNCESSVILAAQGLADEVFNLLPDERAAQKTSQPQENTLSRLYR